MNNPFNWIEIPVSNMERAIEFYNSIFGFKLEPTQMGPLLMAWLPSDPKAPGASGSLVYHEDFYKPSSTEGCVVYFNCEDVAETLKKVEAANGKVIQKKTLIAEDVGYMGLLIDSEGNRIALHSSQ